MTSPCWYALNDTLFSFACFYILCEWNRQYSSMAYGFLGCFKLRLHYLLLSQQMAVDVLELDLGTDSWRQCEVFHIPATMLIGALASLAQILEYPYIVFLIFFSISITFFFFYFLCYDKFWMYPKRDKIVQWTAVKHNSSSAAINQDQLCPIPFFPYYFETNLPNDRSLNTDLKAKGLEK